MSNPEGNFPVLESALTETDLQLLLKQSSSGGVGGGSRVQVLCTELANIDVLCPRTRN